MSGKETITVNGVEIDVEKADKLTKRIVVKEKRNLSTNKYGPGEMVKKIKNMIEEDVECY